MRQSVVRLAGLIIAGAVAAGCSMKPQNVVIDPAPEMMAFNVGQKQSVAVNVVDKRASSLLGYRKDETKEQAPLKTGNDVAAAVAVKVREAVADNAFTVAGGDRADAKLTVEITEITYKASGKYVAPKVATRAAFRAVAERGLTTYSQSYSIANEDVEALPLTAERNERIINETVSQALGMMIEDEGLWRFLATGVVPGAQQ
ncbi:MAG: hypothetical protein DCC73_10865 [Proteobacteria bacterium]|nr:MAG: hypothetical protein DCC73_10865 [Pseudomonadota bacterium]